MGARGFCQPSRQEKRFICQQRYKTFTATKGTVFYRRRTLAELVVIVVMWLAQGCLLPALVAAFRLDERTVADWWARTGQQDRPSKNRWSSHHVTWDTCQPTRSA